MANLTKRNKTFIGLGIGAGLILIAKKALSLSSFYNALDIKLNATFGGYKSGNFVINTVANLDNPKSEQIEITKPTIRIYDESDSLIASSDPSTEKILIQKNAVTPINYEIKVPALSGGLYKLLRTAGINVAQLIQSLIAGESSSNALGITLKVKYFMQVKGVEREWQELITL